MSQGNRDDMSMYFIYFIGKLRCHFSMMTSVHYISCIYETFSLMTKAVNDQQSRGVCTSAADWFDSSLQKHAVNTRWMDG